MNHPDPREAGEWIGEGELPASLVALLAWAPRHRVVKRRFKLAFES